jgi:hypothetical protein
MSVEIIAINIELVGIGSIKAEIKRMLSPITTERIHRTLINEKIITTSGRFLIGNKDYFTIKLNLKKGVEKPTDELKRGEMVYDAATDSLFIALKAGKTKTKYSKLGEIKSGLELLEKAERTVSIKITLVN